VSHRSYALEQLSALELDPLSFVEVAASAGYDAIGIHLEGLPLAHAAPYSLISDRALARAVGARMRDAGVRLHVVEPFLISPDTTRDMHLRNLDLGSQLGAAVAGTLAFDPDSNRRADRLARLAEDAAERGLSLTIEPYLESSWTTLTEAVGAAEAAGGGAGVTLDVLHVIRGGETWETVRDMPAGLIRTIQLSDGEIATPANWPLAAVTDRAVPGDGAFDIAALLPLLPADLPIGIEVPSLALAERMPALERVRYLLERTKALVEGDRHLPAD
jgi:sugar phosphate isomerase/epimerase